MHTLSQSGEHLRNLKKFICTTLSAGLYFTDRKLPRIKKRYPLVETIHIINPDYQRGIQGQHKVVLFKVMQNKSHC